MLLFYDTETTGLPVRGAQSDDPRHPNLLSISTMLDCEAGVTRRILYTLIKPDGFKIDERLEAPNAAGKMEPTAFSFNKITNAQANRFGMPLVEALEMHAEMAATAETTVAFSHHFDL